MAGFFDGIGRMLTGRTRDGYNTTSVGFKVGPFTLGQSYTQPPRYHRGIPTSYYDPASSRPHYPLGYQYGAPAQDRYYVDPYAGRSAPGYAYIPSTMPTTPRYVDPPRTASVPGYAPLSPVTTGLRGTDGRYVNPTNAGRPENRGVGLTSEFRGSDGVIRAGTPDDDRRLSTYYNRPQPYDPRDFRGGFRADPFLFGSDLRPTPRDTVPFALANSMFGVMRGAMDMERARILSMPDSFRDARRDILGTGSVSDIAQVQAAYQRAFLRNLQTSGQDPAVTQTGPNTLQFNNEVFTYALRRDGNDLTVKMVVQPHLVEAARGRYQAAADAARAEVGGMTGVNPAMLDRMVQQHKVGIDQTMDGLAMSNVSAQRTFDLASSQVDQRTGMVTLAASDRHASRYEIGGQAFNITPDGQTVYDDSGYNVRDKLTPEHVQGITMLRDNVGAVANLIASKPELVTDNAVGNDRRPAAADPYIPTMNF